MYRKRSSIFCLLSPGVQVSALLKVPAVGVALDSSSWKPLHYLMPYCAWSQHLFLPCCAAPWPTDRLVSALTQQLYCIPESSSRSLREQHGGERHLEASLTVFKQLQVSGLLLSGLATSYAAAP